MIQVKTFGSLKELNEFKSKTPITIYGMQTFLEKEDTGLPLPRGGTFIYTAEKIRVFFEVNQSITQNSETMKKEKQSADKYTYVFGEGVADRVITSFSYNSKDRLFQIDVFGKDVDGIEKLEMTPEFMIDIGIIDTKYLTKALDTILKNRLG